MGLSWRIAFNFLRDGKAQTLLIIGGVAVGAAVIVFITALVDGLQGNIVQRTLGTQAHIVVSAPDLVPLAPPPPAGTVDLRSTDARPQRLRSINNGPGVLQVLLLRGGRAVDRAVSLGLRGLVASQVVQGLRAGDVVLADPSVHAGQRVRARLQPLPATGASAAAPG